MITILKSILSGNKNKFSIIYLSIACKIYLVSIKLSSVVIIFSKTFTDNKISNLTPIFLLSFSSLNT